MPHLALSAILWRLLRARTQQERGWLYPADAAEVVIAGADPVHVLLIGDGPAAGCGVLTHELGVAGYLTRHVAERLRRGAVVTVRAQPDASARTTLLHLDDSDLDAFDAIVVMLAITDASCLTPRLSWSRSIEALLERLHDAGAASVLVTGAARMHDVRSLSPLAHRLVDDHARVLNIQTRRICTVSGTPMISLGAARDLTPSTYEKWGQRIGEHVVAALQG